jgi:hypothetical protein
LPIQAREGRDGDIGLFSNILLRKGHIGYEINPRNILRLAGHMLGYIYAMSGQFQGIRDENFSESCPVGPALALIFQALLGLEYDKTH